MHDQIIDMSSIDETRPKAAARKPEPLIHIPISSLWSVREVCDEYHFPSLPTLLQPRVLDIGANVGVFALACCTVWPGARVMSFEPHPETFALLKHNTASQPVEPHNQAVIGWQRGSAADLSLHEGKRNRLCCSLFDRGDQDMTTAIPVAAMLAAELPPCDVLKIDTEGCEVEILEAYRHLASVKVLLVEFHGATPDAALAEAQQIMSIAMRAGISQIDQRGNTLRFARHS